ncbi:hypothetical protein WJX73_008379 [Symbiochloris irregularis]|uniref:F-box domain-containing protein n=1 Tax=Symbiochloris irregularis TaxID=706552 RepID=A0AAW1NQH9_9CHLO
MQQGGGNRRCALRPDWSKLPLELLTTIFQQLNTKELVRAELCCKTWHSVLSKPQVPGLWGCVEIKLDELPNRLDLPPQDWDEHDVASEMFLPFCQWLQDRAPGLESLHLMTAIESELTLAELQLLRHLGSLRTLSIWSPPDSISALFPGGMAGYGQALGRLTMLTSLDLRHIGAPEFDPVQLCHMSSLRHLVLNYLDITVDFDVPCAWQNLTKLNLSGNRMNQMPGKLSVLHSLKMLHLEEQYGDFQITEPMDFLTQMKDLSQVQLWQKSDHSWNESSLYALVQGRLLIRKTPGCKVSLHE